MIEANELRIGNWHIGKSRGQYAKITGRMIAHIDEGLYDIDPIPLTPEILEKCGFKEITGFAEGIGEYSWWENYTHIALEINESTDGWYVVGSDYKTFKYLHQLQNLYWCLTGEELTVNL